MAALSTAAARLLRRSIQSADQEPLIMRLNKDEFRIAFAINGERAVPTAARHDSLSSRLETPDGATRTERKHVNFTVSPSRAAPLPWTQYFDTPKGST